MSWQSQEFLRLMPIYLRRWTHVRCDPHDNERFNSLLVKMVDENNRKTCCEEVHEASDYSGGESKIERRGVGRVFDIR